MRNPMRPSATDKKNLNFNKCVTCYGKETQYTSLYVLTFLTEARGRDHTNARHFQQADGVHGIRRLVALLGFLNST